MATERLELEGHIIDSLLLAKVLDTVVAAGADYAVVDVAIGRSAADASRVVLDVHGDDPEGLAALVEELEVHGANPTDADDAPLAAAPGDGVAPAGFHVTTDLATSVRVDGRWHRAPRPERDGALVVARPADGAPGGAVEVRTTPLHRLAAGDLVVVGQVGVRVATPHRRSGVAGRATAPARPRRRPVAEEVEELADRLRDERAAGGRTIAVCGSAVVDAGGGPALAELVGAGWIDVVVAGNGFAVRDVAANLAAPPPEVVGAGAGGHGRLVRAANEVRRWGSVEAAVAGGALRGGVLAACAAVGAPVVLVGALGDTGPLPDVVTDVVAAADAVREHLVDVTVALVLASRLPGLADGRMLPGGVARYRFDLDPATAAATTSADAAHHRGVPTDVGAVLPALAARLRR